MASKTVVCVFERESDLLGATAAVRQRGITIADAYTPYAVHGLDVAMGLAPSRLPVACLALGLTGAVSILGFQFWASTVSWANNVGGRPWNSWPAFIPATFEMLVLFAGVGTVVTFLAIAGLRPWRRVEAPAAGITDDRFALVLLPDVAGDLASIKTLINGFHPLSVEEREA